MKRIIVAVVCILSLALFALPSSAIAEGDAGAGAAVFSANCAACHSGGLNVVNAKKTLQKEALEMYGKDTPEAIIKQVTKGNGAMPGFGGRLPVADIENVAAYVLSQADKGW